MPCAFIDLKKAYDRVPRGKLWECLRLAETSECYIRNINEMYDGVTTTMRSAAGLTEEFKVGVRLHQRLALNPFFFHHRGQAVVGHQEGRIMEYGVRR